MSTTFFKPAHIWGDTMKIYFGKKISRGERSSFRVILVTRLLMVLCVIIFLNLRVKTSSAYVSGQENLKTATQSQVELNEDGVDIVQQESQEPMPVTLTFLAVSQEIYDGLDATHIEWTMSSEIGTRGFHISRSTTDAYDDAVMISGFIPCLGGIHSENMSQYEYWDTRIISTRVTYFYWLEEVKESGHTIYGPLYISSSRTVEDDDIPTGTSELDMNIYLPIIVDW